MWYHEEKGTPSLIGLSEPIRLLLVAAEQVLSSEHPAVLEPPCQHPQFSLSRTLKECSGPKYAEYPVPRAL